MNKADLIDAMAEDAGISKAAAKKALDSFTDRVSATLAGGGRVSLVGFGTFSTSERSAREGRNPQTGETVKIKASNAVGFKVAKALKDYLN